MRIICIGGDNMKRKELIRLLEKNGWTMAREGSNHTVYVKGSKMEAIPRHAEISELLAKAIIKRQNLQ